MYDINLGSGARPAINAAGEGQTRRNNKQQTKLNNKSIQITKQTHTHTQAYNDYKDNKQKHCRRGHRAHRDLRAQDGGDALSSETAYNAHDLPCVPKPYSPETP